MQYSTNPDRLIVQNPEGPLLSEPAHANNPFRLENADYLPQMVVARGK